MIYCQFEITELDKGYKFYCPACQETRFSKYPKFTRMCKAVDIPKALKEMGKAGCGRCGKKKK